MEGHRNECMLGTFGYVQCLELAEKEWQLMEHHRKLTHTVPMMLLQGLGAHTGAHTGPSKIWSCLEREVHPEHPATE